MDITQPDLLFGGGNMNDFTKALDQLEEATNQLLNASVELTERTRRLNQQLQRLVEAIRRQNGVNCDDGSGDIKHSGRLPMTPQPSEMEILAEVKRLLDGT